MGKAVLYACFSVFSIYASASAVLWASQSRLIFEPVRTLVVKPTELGFPVADVTIPVPSARTGRQTLHAWWMPARGSGAKLVLYFHGNEGNVSTSIGGTALLRSLGYSVLVVDYRGYGQSDGAYPSETGVYEDAEAALDALVHEWRFNSQQIYLYGHSLGAAVAIDLAARHPELGGLIVESAFTSIYDMAKLEPKYGIFPVGLLLNQRFESINKVSRLQIPVLYIHGTADRVVPYDMGVALYERSGGRKRFVAVAGGGHDDNAAVAPGELGTAIRELIQ
ncbi:MAG TPA: alpha/beta hydrolase [Burkholderiales bacterium]|nr:alpha/beta hydrolase [Burkholderiales bacterium]